MRDFKTKYNIKSLQNFWSIVHNIDETYIWALRLSTKCGGFAGSVWMMGCWWFLSLMKANVIVHFRNHTFFLFTQPLEKFCRLSIKKLVTNSKSTQWWCGFSKFTHVRTISKTIFFLASHLENDRYTSWWVFKNLQRNCFFEGRRGFHFFFFFKYILWWNIFKQFKQTRRDLWH